MASTKETISGVPQPAGMELAELKHCSDSLGSWDVGIFNSGGRHPAAMTCDANAGVGSGGPHSAVPALDADILTAVRALNGHTSLAMWGFKKVGQLVKKHFKMRAAQRQIEGARAVQCVVCGFRAAELPGGDHQVWLLCGSCM